MGILNAFFDVVAGVSILAGRSSLLDTRLTTVAGRNLTLRTTLGIGFFGVGFVNLWAASRRQKKIDKLAKGSETFAANWLETPDGIRYTKAKEDGTYADWYFERNRLKDKEMTEREINDHLYKLIGDVRDDYLYGDGKEGFGEYCRNSKYDCWDEWDYYNASSRYLDEIGLEIPYLEVMKPHHKDLYDALMKMLQANEWTIYSHNLPAERVALAAEQIGKRGNRKQMMRVGDLKRALRKAKDTDIVLAGDIYDDRVYDTQGIVKHKNYVAILGNKGNHYDEWVQSDEWDYGDNETWSFAESFNAEKIFGVVDNSGDGSAFIGDYKNRKEIMKDYFVWLIHHLEELDHDEALKSINYPPLAIQRVYEKMDADDDEENWDENMALMDKRFDSWYNQLSAKKIRTFIDKWGDSVLWYGPEGHSQGLYTVDDTLEEGLQIDIEGSLNPILDVSAETFSAPAAVMRTYKGRKSPALSAKSVKVGTRKRGNDGRMWQVRRAGKTQRWFRD